MTEPMDSELHPYSNVQSMFPPALPLLQLVMKKGKRLYPTEPLGKIAERTAQSVASLPSETRCLNQPISPTIQISSALQKLTATTRH